MSVVYFVRLTHLKEWDLAQKEFEIEELPEESIPDN